MPSLEAWRREAEEALRRLSRSEEEKQMILKQRDEALSELEFRNAQGVGSRFGLRELTVASVPQLTLLQRQLYTELEQVQQVT